MLLHPLVAKELADQHVQELREDARRSRLARANRSESRRPLVRRVLRPRPAHARAN